MNKKVFGWALLLAMFSAMGLFAQKKKSAQASASDKSKTEVPVADAIQWISVEELEQKMKKEPRKVIFDFYTDWCGWCKVMDKKTFSNKELARYVNKYYYAVKFNAESKAPLTFMGKTYEYVPEYKSHRFAAEMMSGKMSYPTTVIAGKNMAYVNPIPGYQRLDQMETLLKYFVSVEEPGQASWEKHMREFKASWAPGPEAQ